jgi:hypothetical protein
VRRANWGDPLKHQCVDALTTRLYIVYVLLHEDSPTFSKPLFTVTGAYLICAARKAYTTLSLCTGNIRGVLGVACDEEHKFCAKGIEIAFRKIKERAIPHNPGVPEAPPVQG